MCCGPCSIYPLRNILGRDIEVHGFFYNPNIHPFEEFKRRIEAAKKLAGLMEIDAIFHEDYEPRPFFCGLPGIDKKRLPKEERCAHCYALRLDRTARTARDHGFDFFTSSLLYSKFQDHEGIISLGLDMEQKYRIPFYYEDFREGWKEGIQESRRMGLYRQKYCGCIFSRIERGL